MNGKLLQVWVGAGLLAGFFIFLLLFLIIAQSDVPGPDHSPPHGEELLGGEETVDEKPMDPYLDDSWSFSGATGPAHWGAIRDEFAVCSTGTQQSPINITASALELERPELRFEYSTAELLVRVGSERVSAVVENEQFLHWDGQSFQLESIQIHTPSEHLLNGAAASAEVQLIHRGAGGLLHVALLLQLGQENQGLESIWKVLGGYPDRAVAPGQINLAEMLPEQLKFYTYQGSQTHPPCREDVMWIVIEAGQTIAKEQQQTLQRIVGKNVRPVQSKTREVKFYRYD